eukprot:1143305-Pelagomonas_calceolata.AAC.9
MKGVEFLPQANIPHFHLPVISGQDRKGAKVKVEHVIYYTPARKHRLRHKSLNAAPPEQSAMPGEN